MKILNQLLALLGIVSSSKDGQKRRNLRILLRKQGKFERILKRRGLTDKELQMLEEINDEILKAMKALNTV